VVLPLAVDADVFLGEPFAVEAGCFEDFEGGVVVGHDAGFEAVEVLEGVGDEQLDGFGRVAFVVVVVP